MKYRLTLVITTAALCCLTLSGCITGSAKIPSEDLDVLKLYRQEIAVLHSELPPNSEGKYRAAKKLLDNVDFTYTRSVETLDDIFSSRDARVDAPSAANQMIMFYYQYKDQSVRFVFYRYNNMITRVETYEK